VFDFHSDQKILSEKPESPVLFSTSHPVLDQKKNLDAARKILFLLELIQPTREEAEEYARERNHGGLSVW
jgi:hypothetical protein